MRKLIQFFGGLFALLGSIIIPSLLLKKSPANKNTTSVIDCVCFHVGYFPTTKKMSPSCPPPKKKTTPQPFDPP